MKMKIFTWFLALGLMIFSGHLLLSQNRDRGIENDPKAQVLLDQVSSKFKSYKSLMADFSLKVYSKDDGLDEVYPGKVWLKGEKYKIDSDQYEIVCDNVKRYVYLKSSNEVQINFYEPEEGNVESPSQLFTMYQKDFYYRIVGDEILNGVNTKMVELIPINIQKSSYKRVMLYVDPVKQTIKKAKIDSKDGIQYTWEIKSFKPDQAVDDSVFKFDKSKYPGITVEDMTN